ncbi:MAG TPA: hypothetical protein VMF09_15800 [Solirubrobacteraceae bacterium]|nr:hypothetical protein [Solirubrobacteraceae bacterium]
MSAPKKDCDHESGLVPGHNDKDRAAIACLAGKPKVAAFIQIPTRGVDDRALHVIDVDPVEPHRVLSVPADPHRGHQS